MDLQKFLDSATNSTHTRTKMKRAVELFNDFLASKGMTLNQAKGLKSVDFRELLDTIGSQSYKITVRTTLKKLAAYQNEIWDLPTEAIHVIRKEKAEVMQRILTDDEIRLLNDAALLSQPRERAIYFVLRDTGLNYNEFLALHVGDIQADFIRIKGMYDRRLPITSETIKALNDYLTEREHPNEDEFLWIGPKGTLTSHRVSTLLRNMSMVLSRPITASDLRHTLTLKLFEQGMSPVEVTRFLGLHSLQQLQNLNYVKQYLR